MKKALYKSGKIIIIIIVCTSLRKFEYVWVWKQGELAMPIKPHFAQLAYQNLNRNVRFKMHRQKKSIYWKGDTF